MVSGITSVIPFQNSKISITLFIVERLAMQYIFVHGLSGWGSYDKVYRRMPYWGMLKMIDQLPRACPDRGKNP
jgi:hypothetical protein